MWRKMTVCEDECLKEQMFPRTKSRVNAMNANWEMEGEIREMP